MTTVHDPICTITMAWQMQYGQANFMTTENFLLSVQQMARNQLDDQDLVVYFVFTGNQNIDNLLVVIEDRPLYLKYSDRLSPNTMEISITKPREIKWEPEL